VTPRRHFRPLYAATIEKERGGFLERQPRYRSLSLRSPGIPSGRCPFCWRCIAWPLAQQQRLPKLDEYEKLFREQRAHLPQSPTRRRPGVAGRLQEHQRELERGDPLGCGNVQSGFNRSLRRPSEALGRAYKRESWRNYTRKGAAQLNLAQEAVLISNHQQIGIRTFRPTPLRPCGSATYGQRGIFSGRRTPRGPRAPNKSERRVE